MIDVLEYTHYTVPPDGKSRMRGETHFVAFIVRSGQALVRVDLGPAAPVTAAVDEWHKHNHGGAAALAMTLRRLVWEPLEPHVKEVSMLLISPDGALARFPFAALPGKEPGTYVVEEHAFAVVPVPQLLPQVMDIRTAETDGTPSLLLVGDVDYGAEPVKDAGGEVSRWLAPRGNTEAALPAFRQLLNTRAEVVAIKDSFKRSFRRAAVTEHREAEATEYNFRQQAPKHRYLHLATHGFFAPPSLRSALATTKVDTPLSGSLFSEVDISGWHPGLLSGLVLAGVNQPVDPDRDDGILTALEVGALDFSGVNLAVLSACETGLGEVAGGEGLLGLQRAFHTAGAKSVVASLWGVKDDVTLALMQQFYENLWVKNMFKAEALRQAQLSVMREGAKRGVERVDQPADRVRRLPPYYWAGFVLSGDWR